MARIVIKQREAVKVDQLYVEENQNPFGAAFYVNYDTGSDSNNGHDPLAPFAKIATAVSTASAGDTIFLRGTAFSECVAISKAGLKFRGLGTCHNEIVWTAPDDGYCAWVTAKNVRFENIRFRPPAYAAAPALCTITSGTGTITSSPVALTIGSNTPTFTVAGTATVILPKGITGTAATNGATVTGSPVTLTEGGSTTLTIVGTGTITITLATVPCAIRLGATTENVADYCEIVKCRYSGKANSYVAIYAPCVQDDIHIYDNIFVNLNNITTVYGTAILGMQASPWDAYSSWIIRGNEFKAPAQGIKLAGRGCIIENNNFSVNGLLAVGTMGAVTGSAGSKKMIDLRGNGAEANCNDVHGNFLGGAYNNTLYFQANSLDDWSGNFTIAGITTALPTT